MSHFLEKCPLRFLLFILFLTSLHARAETPQGQAPNPAGADAGADAGMKSATAILKTKLQKEGGGSAKILLLPPVDYTNLKMGRVVGDTIYRSVARYGTFDIIQKNSVLSSLTLEEFRKITIAEKAEVLLISVLKPNAFDLFLYDRRAPYYIYAYSQDLPDTNFYKMSEGVATHYTRLLVRRLLYRYVQNQFYELPREDKPVVIPKEIPRLIASAETLAMINNEMTSGYYMGATVGSALSRGTEGKFWNSNLIGLILGLRMGTRSFLDLEIDGFAYNAFTLSYKYVSLSKDSPFRTSFGIGASHVIAQKTLDWDQTNGLGWHSSYVTPSIGVLLPISDIMIKFEARLFTGIDLKRFIFTFAPGLILNF